jgi:cobalt-zinc-cadmium efflux system membrane fusion protein
MKTLTCAGSACCSLVVALGLVALGCGTDGKQEGSGDRPRAEGKKPGVHQVGEKGDAAAKKASEHNDWWCAEHGIPEHLCSMCNDKVAGECKEKGDWCKEHDRARSQCFKCNPKLKEKFAAMYRARYSGKEPPPVEEK